MLLFPVVLNCQTQKAKQPQFKTLLHCANNHKIMNCRTGKCKEQKRDKKEAIIPCPARLSWLVSWLETDFDQ